jgi:hypothetical protein
MKLPIPLRDVVFFLILLTGLYLIYGHLFETDAFLAYDDSLISKGLESIHSFSDYIHSIRNGSIPDLQPVRDLFTWINYRLLDLTGKGHFHLMNVLVFILLLGGIRKGLQLLFERSGTLIDALVLLIAFSPLQVSSVAWISARKHLLSGALTVWATVSLIRFLQGQRRQWIIFTVLFLLAVFSQPINLFWPCFALMSMFLYGQKRLWKFLIPSFIIAAIVGYLNLRYYDSIYVWISGGFSKFQKTKESGWGASYLAYGRYFLQTLVPYWTSVGEYDIQSWQNIAGLMLIPPYYYLLSKLTDMRKAVLIAIAFTTGLIPVIAKITNRFGTDNYLVTASIPLMVGFFLILRHSGLKTKILAPILLVAIGAEFQLSRTRAQAWTDTFSIFEQAYELESGFINQFQFTDWLLNRGDVGTAYPLAVDLYERHPEKLGANNMLARAITMTDLSLEKKVELFVQFRFFSRPSRLLLANLEFLRNKPEKTYEIIESVLSGTESVNGIGYRCSLIADLWKKSCVKMGRTDCEQLDAKVSSKCNEDHNL